MRVGRVRAGAILETRQNRRRVQRALAAGQAQADRVRDSSIQALQSFAAVIKEVTLLAVERAESLDDLRLHQKGRFEALTRVHAMLLRDGGLVDFETLVWDELAAGICPCEEDRITIAGPPVAFDREPAELMAILLHELATNAVKFGALSVEEGRVDVIWDRKRDGETLCLSWLESGAPVCGQGPVRCGFGREVIETILPRRLGAQTRFTLSGAGLRCEIELPLVHLTEQGASELAVAA